MTPEEIARGDALAARALIAAVLGDQAAQLTALHELRDAVEIWDFVDAVTALARDLLAELAVSDAAVTLMRRRLLLAALREVER
ncbi:hypothetical protein ORV05_26310 [Amycolatopsis cynarae]|uniref:Uncharacterized protein n=1 Tax=Amycolatopsis cynarae TaxID=2995223 RepID=A0ABY7AXN1_9PSEU|nr:hypothetical protein [Amycolatopsis sp. HUAS 11-8]WAL64460.1 hypothetical protein ORV05_26310 [Amycolatopsis sp. HUAS 11-8]